LISALIDAQARLPEAAPGSLSTNPSDDRVCFESWNSWRLADGRWRESLLFATEYITTSWSASYRIQQPVGEGFLYSDCDGIPRFGFHSPPTKSTYTTVTVTQSALQHAVNQNLNYTVFSEGSPEPNCTVSDSFCEKFLQAEALKQSESGADEFAYMNGQGLSRLNRPCTFCHLDSNAEVILIYWPPALTSRDICAKNGYGAAITVSHSDTVPKTATMDAITFNGIGVKRIDATDGSFLDLRKHYCRSISSTFTSPASGGKGVSDTVHSYSPSDA
jgi:hypothetical protein